MGFLDRFKDRKNDEKHGTEYAIHHDKWDMDDWNSISEEMKELDTSTDQLAQFTPTGREAMTDMFFALMKGDPRLEDAKNMRPSFLVDRAVLGEAMELKEYDELRMYSTQDEIASGLACVAMKPELEIIFDKLEDQVEKAKQLAQIEDQIDQAEEDLASAEEMLENLEDGSEEAQNWQEHAAAAQEQLDKLREQLEQGSQELQQDLHQNAPMIKEAMKNAMKGAAEDAEGMDQMAAAWGPEQGGLKRLPAERRIELAKKFKNDKFKKMAELIGPLTRMAMAEQAKKIISSKDEIYDLEFGNNLSYVLPMEYLLLDDEVLELEFYRKFYDGGLVQFKLQGQEKVAKGGIIYCEDGSGSMMGEREVWAKAVGLAFLQIARSQKRDFYGIHFGGVNETKTFDFDTKSGTCVSEHRGTVEHLDRIDGVIHYAETFFGGGTDFMTPLAKAIDKLSQQYDKDKATKGDIVFATDGQCAVPQQFLDRLKEEKERLGFRIFGIAIGTEPHSEPLNEICDGRVFRIKDLIEGVNRGAKHGMTQAGGIKDIFRGV